MKKTTQLIIGIIALIVILGSALYLIGDSKPAVTGKSVSQDMTPVKIGYRNHLLFLPAYVAQENNYYAEQGLQVELVSFDSTNQLVEAVLTGDIDAAVGGVNAIVPLTIEGKAPGSLKIFNLGFLTDDFDALLVSADSDIRSVQDLEGKTISSLPGIAAKIWMDMMLDKEGLTGKVNVIQTADSQQLNALSSGNADAIFVLEPLATIGKKKGISRTLVKSPISTYFRTDLIFETSVFSTSFVEKRPETTRKIVAAVDKAILFIDDNPDIARKYYSEFTPVEDSMEDELPVARYTPSYAMDAEEFQDVADLLFDTGLIDEKVGVSAILLK